MTAVSPRLVSDQTSYPLMLYGTAFGGGSVSLRLATATNVSTGAAACRAADRRRCLRRYPHSARGATQRTPWHLTTWERMEGES